jgi:hypothetical protein
MQRESRESHATFLSDNCKLGLMSEPAYIRRYEPGEEASLFLADEVRYSILPILIGDGIPFFEKLDRDIPLHLAEIKAYKSGKVGLCYQVRGHGEPRTVNSV